MKELFDLSRSGTHDVKSLENYLIKRIEENGDEKLDNFSALRFRKMECHQLMQGTCQDIHGDTQDNIDKKIEVYSQFCKKTKRDEFGGFNPLCREENMAQNITKNNLSEDIQNQPPHSMVFLNLDKLPAISALPAPLDETKGTEHLPASGRYLELQSRKDGKDLNSIGGSTQTIAHLPQQIYAPAAIGGKAGAIEDKKSQEYLEKRKRNNEAVKKSRLKAKKRENEIRETNECLKNENERLKRELAALMAIVGKHCRSVKNY